MPMFNFELVYVFVFYIFLQDLWIPYFNITTDITASAMRAHTDGQRFPSDSSLLLFLSYCGLLTNGMLIQSLL